MDAALQDFLGNKPSMETQKPEPQPADTQEQASGAVQEKADEAVPEQTDETPQVVRRSTREPSSLFRPLRTASPYSSAAARAMPSTALSACSASDG